MRARPVVSWILSFDVWRTGRQTCRHITNAVHRLHHQMLLAVLTSQAPEAAKGGNKNGEVRTPPPPPSCFFSPPPIMSCTFPIICTHRRHPICAARVNVRAAIMMWHAMLQLRVCGLDFNMEHAWARPPPSCKITPCTKALWKLASGRDHPVWQLQACV